MNEQLSRFKELTYKDIRERKLRHALALIIKFAGAKGKTEILNRAKNLDRRYFYMLKSMAGGNPDPNQDKEIQKSLDHALVLANSLMHEISADQGERLLDSYVRYGRLRPEESTATISVDFLEEHSRVLSDPKTLLDNGRRAPLEKMSRELFHRLWAEYPLNDDSVDAIGSLLEDPEIPEADRESWLGALILGTLEFYDPNKIGLIIRSAGSDSLRMRAAAISGLVFAMMIYGKIHYSDILKPSFLSTKIPGFENDLRITVEEFLRQKGATVIAERVEKEILPALQKMASGMMDKFRNIDLKGKTPEELQALLGGENPSDSDMRHSMQSINDMAEEGDDVFYAFLKPVHQLPFFNDIANWWIPFDSSRSEFAEIFEGEGAMLGEMFNDLGFLCDSDKYAVLMSVAAAPAGHRSQTMSMMVDQYAHIADMLPHADLENEDREYRMAVANFMKNAFRFFNLFRRKGEFVNVFSQGNPFNMPEFASLYLESDPDRALEMAERMYKSGLVAESSAAYERGLSDRSVNSVDVFLRASDAVVAAGNKAQALNYLDQALEIDETSEKALSKLIILDEEGSHVLSALDNLGIDRIENPYILKDYFALLHQANRPEDALRAVNKALYIVPSSNYELKKYLRLRRGELLLLNGNPIEAAEELESLLSDTSRIPEEGLTTIRIILGHAYLSIHDTSRAFNSYLAAIKGGDRDRKLEILSKTFDNLKDLLIKEYTVSEGSITAMMDAIFYASTEDSDF